MSKEIESVIKTSQPRKQDRTRELYWRILPNIQIMNNHPSQTPPKNEEERTLPNSFYKASTILISKPKTTQENYRPISMIEPIISNISWRGQSES